MYGQVTIEGKNGKHELGIISSRGGKIMYIVHAFGGEGEAACHCIGGRTLEIFLPTA